jgi:hypothetical protein
MLQRSRCAFTMGTLAFLAFMPKAIFVASSVEMTWYHQWYMTLMIPLLFTGVAVSGSVVLGWLISFTPLRKYWHPGAFFARFLSGLTTLAVVALVALPEKLPADEEWLKVLFLPAWFLMIFSVAGWHESLLARVEPKQSNLASH